MRNDSRKLNPAAGTSIPLYSFCRAKKVSVHNPGGAIMHKELHRELPCALTDAELSERSARLAVALAERDALENERKKIAAGYKRRIDDLSDEITRVGDAVRTGAEKREVLCHTQAQLDGGVLIVREDTGEVVQTIAPGVAAQIPLWPDDE